MLTSLKFALLLLLFATPTLLLVPPQLDIKLDSYPAQLCPDSRDPLMSEMRKIRSKDTINSAYRLIQQDVHLVQHRVYCVIGRCRSYLIQQYFRGQWGRSKPRLTVKAQFIHNAVQARYHFRRMCWKIQRRKGKITVSRPLEASIFALIQSRFNDSKAYSGMELGKQMDELGYDGQGPTSDYSDRGCTGIVTVSRLRTQGSGRRIWHRFANEGIKYPVPAHWPANHPLPANYYPKDPPPGYVSQLIPDQKGAIGIEGKGTGTASPKAHHPEHINRQPYGIPQQFSYYRERVQYTKGPGGQLKRVFIPAFEAAPPCPPGKTVGPFDTLCTLPACPAGQNVGPNNGPCQLPYCPFGQLPDKNKPLCQLPPCLPGFRFGPFISPCKLPPCPPGKQQGPFGAQCEIVATPKVASTPSSATTIPATTQNTQSPQATPANANSPSSLTIVAAPTQQITPRSIPSQPQSTTSTITSTSTSTNSIPAQPAVTPSTQAANSTSISGGSLPSQPASSTSTVSTINPTPVSSSTVPSSSGSATVTAGPVSGAAQIQAPNQVNLIK